MSERLHKVMEFYKFEQQHALTVLEPCANWHLWPVYRLRGEGEGRVNVTRCGCQASQTVTLFPLRKCC